MKASEIRQKFLDFFERKGHAVIPSAPLLPENDPTVLFTTAGMHPLVPYLLGEAHPAGKRLVNFQKCIRTGDIDEVGDDTHLTFFEMMGNWSLGDYSKKEAVEWSFEFLTGEKWLNIPLKMLSVTVFKGDKDCPVDEESAQTWKALGVPEHKIAYLPKKDNWWGPAGETGPCGPDSEMFYYIGGGTPPESSNVETDEDNWVEIWNDVFMQYNKTDKGTYEPLEQKNVDTGLGLERVAAVLQGKKTVYDTELFQPILSKIASLTEVSYEENMTSYRVIADHLRSATFLAADGVAPSNLDQGYVMRRLMRRAIRHGHTLGIEKNFTHEIAKTVIDLMGDIYPELKKENEILAIFKQEEERFRRTLIQGLRELKKLVDKKKKSTQLAIDFSTPHKESERYINMISGKEAFYIYETYGFPLEMIEEELAREAMCVSREEYKESMCISREEFRKEFYKANQEGFKEAFEEHQKKSRAGAEGKFKGGLQDHSEATTRLHTATHLLHAALQKVLGKHAVQRGSNITAERLRFDFPNNEKLSPEQIEALEAYVNEAVASNHKVTWKVETIKEAGEEGAIGLFTDKYDEKVKVYNMGPWSHEVCGGPHVEQLGQLGRFKITKEQSCSAGVRRIKAVLLDENGEVQG